ncbi:MAG: DUF1634 domain-containing protein [Euryarchaeota archaeon]|nr:DUF1634 domain-containing protein [Euryarchaeota archaeon]MDE1835427.1 DUF1634 domain-containing protein [Euryarchaeota archaeon]MDE1879563.1 DUF1634 domain-containing protein [Euryarchaeota archaeon]MDE2046078.1 DUF1634 domain-containing protein [Thermoplasmata archaeon]
MSTVAGEPSSPTRAIDLAQLSERLGRLLAAGVLASAFLLAVGVVVIVVLAPGTGMDGLLSARSRGSWGPASPGVLLIASGIVVLVATPVARVLLAARAFATAGEDDYLGLVLAVLLILTLSVVVGYWLPPSL